MKTFIYKNKSYEVDDFGFLDDYKKWDKDFADGMAFKLGISDGLSKKHWDVINYIKQYFEKTGSVPLVYKTCQENDLSASKFKKLFPTGYMRGACKLAGITYRDRIINYFGETHFTESKVLEKAEIENLKKKVYRVDIYGFLIDPNEWDENYAILKAEELKIPNGLTEKHWKIIKFLRENFIKSKEVPNMADCCEANKIELEDLEMLFPDGYQRGAVKISGLRV